MNKNKCTLCKERNGNTRCEGCNTLFCLPCMNKHHDELAQQFQLVMDARNEVKQTLDIHGLSALNEDSVAYLKKVNEWEQDMIQRIQAIAAKVRTDANEMMTKYMEDLCVRFQQLSDDVQEQQKQGSYFEDDIERMKIELTKLKNDIENIQTKVRVDYSKANQIDWDTLISIMQDEVTNEAKPTLTPDDTASNIVQVRVLNGNGASSTSAKFNFNQHADRFGRCTCSANYNNGLLSRGVCTECDRNSQLSTFPYSDDFYSSMQDTYSPRLDPSQTLLMHCPHCKNMAFMERIPNSFDYQYKNTSEMKCQLCNEKKGSTRCEGCDMLLCLVCMTTHQTELMEQFQQLLNMRNELKESSDLAEKVSQDQTKLSCFIEINRWEQDSIVHIREVANKIRSNITIIMTKNLEDIRTQLEQLSVTMQQQQKEENYLENELTKIKAQLTQLKETISHVNEKIHVVIANNINWDTLIHVMQDQDLIELDCNRNRLQYRRKDLSNNRITTNQHCFHERSAFRPTNTLRFNSNGFTPFRPITPVNLNETDASDSERTSPVLTNIVPVDKIVPMLTNSEQPFSWSTRIQNRQTNS
ncbi:unnamed protein product [Adineta ricciae]|uniref:B box-type domain-containing protein n=1 Tax=Adineta ricciae TaxID=249248 RepID=A0A814XU78_ADIRI|nr:unnamed protein product [Adineta ricciae]